MRRPALDRERAEQHRIANMDGQKTAFCGKPVYKLCNSRIFIHRNFSFYMKLLLRPRTKRLIIPVDRETFGWIDSPDQEAFGRSGPPGREVFGRNDPRIRKSSDGTIHRTRKPSGGAVHRVGKSSDGTVHGSGSLRAERSTDQEVFGRNGPRVGKPSGGTIHRTRKSSDGTVHGSGSLRAERSDGSESLRTA